MELEAAIRAEAAAQAAAAAEGAQAARAGVEAAFLEVLEDDDDADEDELVAALHAAVPQLQDYQSESQCILTHRNRSTICSAGRIELFIYEGACDVLYVSLVSFL